MIYDLSEEFNFLSCKHVYEMSKPSFSNEAIYKRMPQILNIRKIF